MIDTPSAGARAYGASTVASRALRAAAATGLRPALDPTAPAPFMGTYRGGRQHTNHLRGVSTVSGDCRPCPGQPVGCGWR